MGLQVVLPSAIIVAAGAVKRFGAVVCSDVRLQPEGGIESFGAFDKGTLVSKVFLMSSLAIVDPVPKSKTFSTN